VRLARKHRLFLSLILNELRDFILEAFFRWSQARKEFPRLAVIPHYVFFQASDGTQISDRLVIGFLIGNSVLSALADPQIGFKLHFNAGIELQSAGLHDG
jgi:hypothetical protein